MPTLQQSAARAGAHRWLELAVWEVLGGWATAATAGTAPAPAAAAVLFDVHAQHAAWRAEQWWDRLPVLAGVDRDELVRPPSAGLAAVIAHLRPTIDNVDPAVTTTVARAAAAYRVLLPRLVAGYAKDRSATVAPASDGPSRRTLHQVETDAADDWRAGESLLHLLLVDASSIEEAATAVSTLERLLL